MRNLIRTWNNYFAYPCFDYQTNEENGFEYRTFFFLITISYKIVHSRCLLSHSFQFFVLILWILGEMETCANMITNIILHGRQEVSVYLVTVTHLKMFSVCVHTWKPIQVKHVVFLSDLDSPSSEPTLLIIVFIRF